MTTGLTFAELNLDGLIGYKYFLGWLGSLRKHDEDRYPPAHSIVLS